MPMTENAGRVAKNAGCAGPCAGLGVSNFCTARVGRVAACSSVRFGAVVMGRSAEGGAGTDFTAAGRRPLTAGAVRGKIHGGG